MDKIISSLDIAKYYGFSTTREWMMDHSRKLHEKGICPVVFSGKINNAIIAIARIDHGRWIADCPACKKAMYVDPQEKILVCVTCGNEGTGTAVMVEFPENYQKIENALLMRPVISNREEKNILIRVIQEQPSIPGFYRNWKSGIAVERLESENIKAGLL